VRGDTLLRCARVAIGDPATRPIEIDLHPEDYTAVARFDGLEPATRYQIVARFAPSRLELEHAAVERRGTVPTFPRDDASEPFSFLLGSCNLSTMRLRSVYAFVVGLLGASAVRRSLERPVDTWYGPPVVWARYPLRWLGQHLAAWLVGGVQYATRFELPADGNLVDLGTSDASPSPATPKAGRRPRLDASGPFRALRAELMRHQPSPAFMVHAGDQILFRSRYTPAAAPRKE